MRIVAVIALLGLAACTAKEERGMQRIHVSTQPAMQASCTLQNTEGSWYAITPSETKVRRAQNPLVVRCEHQHYVGQVQINAQPDPWMAVASTVDGFTGPLYSYPSSIAVSMAARPR